MFNKDALTFRKTTKDLNSDEMFALGYVLSLKDSLSIIMEQLNPEITSDELENIVKNLVSYDDLCDLWDKLSVDLELDIRPMPNVEIFEKY